MANRLGTTFYIMCAVLLSLAGSAGAADLPGAKDPDFLKRFKGSEIIGYVERPFDQIKMGDSSGKVMPPMEGQVTQIIYHVPASHTALELLRNYQARQRIWASPRWAKSPACRTMARLALPVACFMRFPLAPCRVPTATIPAPIQTATSRSAISRQRGT